MYLPQLNITRFVAALSIVVLHFGLFTWPFNTDIISQWANKGTSAVSFFFVLSGFILVVASLKDGALPESIPTRKFWINRVARIVPLYLFCLVVFFAFHFKYDPSIPLQWQIQSYYYSVFFLQTWPYAMALDVNYPAWTLSVEAFFYFTFPWFFWQFTKLSSKRLIYIALIAWIGNTLIYRNFVFEGLPHNFVHYYPLLHVATFIVGVIAGILFIRHQAFLAERENQLLIITGASAVFLLYAAYKNFTFFSYQHNGLLAPFFVLVIYSLSLSKGPIARFFGNPVFVFAGEISYALYLLQVPVMEYSVKYIPYFQGKEVKDFFYSYLVILLVCAVLAYFIIERPMRTLIKKLV